ncbi:hypothetical protein Tco_1014643 [Tanacetum coccineum]
MKRNPSWYSQALCLSGCRALLFGTFTFKLQLYFAKCLERDLLADPTGASVVFMIQGTLLTSIVFGGVDISSTLVAETVCTLFSTAALGAHDKGGTRGDVSAPGWSANDWLAPEETKILSAQKLTHQLMFVSKMMKEEEKGDGREWWTGGLIDVNWFGTGKSKSTNVKSSNETNGQRTKMQLKNMLRPFKCFPKQRFTLWYEETLSFKSEASQTPTRRVIHSDSLETIPVKTMANRVTLVDDESKPLKKVNSSGDYDSDDEVASVDNKMANFLASKKDIPDKVQAICDKLDIKVHGRKKK